MLKQTLAVALIAGAIAAGAATTVLAADEVNTAPGLTAIGAPLGLHGADPVALLDHGKDIDGNATVAVQHDGVAYYFASEANKTAFEANPARYIPQNGGFCTFGVSVGKKFDGNPTYNAVVDDKLYVFLNAGVFEAFNRDRAGTIAKAAQNWQEIESIAATDL